MFGSQRTTKRPSLPVRVLLATTVTVSLVTITCAEQSAHAAGSSATQHQLVPAYFFPGSDDATPWKVMCSRMNTSKGASIAVMNPASGPGARASLAYVEAIAYCHQLHQQVIGYVHTSYTGRPLADVLHEIDHYYALYNIDGIFVDEMANAPDGIVNAPGFMTVATYYGRIYRHVKLANPTRNTVVGNPGTPAATAWQITLPVADNVVVFEGTAATYLAWTPPAWVTTSPSNKITQLVHTTTATQSGVVCALSRARNAGFVDVTDDSLPNPWDTLATYWNTVAPACV